MNPALLDKALKNVDFPTSDDVLVDASYADDAGIIRLDKDLALVQTTDFFTPVVDDPFLFGQIAAANALSDIYAMGAEPLAALNIVCFPDSHLDDEALRLIMQGGADKVKESGAVILGGHSVSDKELKYGLAVTGKIHPDRIKLNHNLKSGDILLLTKPIGTGILTTALKNDLYSESDLPEVLQSMQLLNHMPGNLLNKYPVSACTDISGYGLLGHLWEMMDGLKVGVQLSIKDIPFFDQAIPLAKDSNHIPAGTLANQMFHQNHIDMGKTELWYQNILFDPQTSGGLLISLPETYVDSFIKDLKDYPFPVTSIGRVTQMENIIYLI